MKKVICLVLAVLLALSMVSALAAEYTDKDTVKKVQQALNDAGYECGTPDGIAGKKTYAAITGYQTDKGLTVTGVIDDELLVSLGLAEAERAPAETGVEAPAETEPAEEVTVEEGYTFQGIPWGSSPDEVEAALLEKGMIAAGTFHLSEGSAAYYPHDEVEQSIKDKNITALGLVLGAPGYNSTSGIGGTVRLDFMKTVGGIEAKYAMFHFLYTVVDGQITSDLELMDVQIPLNADKSRLAELSDKLCESYGNHTEQKDSFSFIRFWEGPDHSLVILVAQDGLEKLIYTKSDTYLRVQEIQAIQAAGKPKMEDAGL